MGDLVKDSDKLPIAIIGSQHPEIIYPSKLPASFLNTLAGPHDTAEYQVPAIHTIA